MSLTILYTAFINASNESKKFLDIKCMSCHYCNNCPFCELYTNIMAINEWFLEHFKNPTLLIDNTERTSLLIELKRKNKLQYSYDHQGFKFPISFDFDEESEIDVYNSCLKDLILLCLYISRDNTYTKIEDKNKKIISENNNDTILIEIGISLFSLIIKARCNLEVPFIINCIKENKKCLIFNKIAINKLIENVDINIYYDIVNNPDKYFNLIDEFFKVYYSSLFIHCVEN